MTDLTESTDLTVNTIPNPIIAGKPATITYQSSAYLPIRNNKYVLKNQLGVTVSSVFTADNSDLFTFTNVYIMTGLNVLYIYNRTSTSMSPTFNINVSALCFRQVTKNFSYNKVMNNKYIPIKQLNNTVFNPNKMI
jgi:hypothetical protein